MTDRPTTVGQDGSWEVTLQIMEEEEARQLSAARTFGDCLPRLHDEG